MTSASDWMGALHKYALRSDGHMSYMATEYEFSDGSQLGADNHDYWWDSTWQNAGGPQLTQISAGRDAYGHAECYGLATDGSVWVFDSYGSMYGGSWSHLGGANVTQISAGNNSTVYALLNNHTIWSHTNSSGWLPVNTGFISGGPSYVLQISAGTTDINGSNTLWAMDGNHAVWELNPSWTNIAHGGWNYYGGWVSQISATAHNNVYVLGGGNDVYTLSSNNDFFFGRGWVDTHFVATTISAGTDWTGSYDRLVALDRSGTICEYSQFGPQAGWSSDRFYTFHYDPAPRTAIAIVASEWAGWGEGDQTMYMAPDHSINRVTYFREEGYYYAVKEYGGTFIDPNSIVQAIHVNVSAYAKLAF
jgi:hypothetical protein